MLSLPPLSLYVHIPWCVRKCPYCDFNSHAFGNTLPEEEYVAALRRDLLSEKINAYHRPIESIFFGGGTPSLFSGKAIGAILDAADDIIGIAKDAEITLEANPGTVEQQKFSDFFTAGVNRLSIGVQSFQSEQLTALGRIHTSQEASNAVKSARTAGIENINIDLMHGLPNQSLDDALADLTQALSLEPTHLSWYQLTIEPNTEFYSAPPILPADDTLADIQDAGHDLLDNAGFAQYEVSAYASPNNRCRHNLNYWQFGDYLGIGAGAHGKVTHLNSDSSYPNDTIERRWKTRQPAKYLERDSDFCAGKKTIVADALPLEFFMNTLRLNEGVERDLFPARTGLQEDQIISVIRTLTEKTLLKEDAQRYCTTPLGHRFLNHVLAMFEANEHLSAPE
ncbi:radical SAM family heme chaperone HemW [Marinibactrum halimedae]|uniref:Heme chaperone HemW n=1 Tax=Marinibactrum halimedae TaxID=1444977 RepID=A0AA37WN40_9GAMM|nr:radical SAM family heme chaperone HemW [Marinibactrum halimedae]MCD9458310.1 radical SAM family heme chaperone HemW [Marinibactrum halimedae]GLS27063.1 YggW family oxidoreductase [Marinibactrum halimedae]